MLYKVTFGFILTVCVCSILQAQNIKTVGIQYQYTTLPSKPLPKEVKDYTVDLDLQYIYSADSRTEVENLIKSKAVITGLTKAEASKLKLLVRLEPYYKENFEIKTNIVEEKRGDATIKVPYYYIQMNYKYPLYYELLIEGKSEPFAFGFLGKSNEYKQYKSDQNRSYGDLEQWWSGNNSSVQRVLRTNVLKETTDDLFKVMSNDFSFIMSENSLYFNTVKENKNFSYDDMDQVLEKVDYAFDAYENTDLIANEKFKERMKTPIEMWEKILLEAEPENKKARIDEKVTVALLENIFLAYASMDEFEKAEEARSRAQVYRKYPFDFVKEDFFKNRESKYMKNKGINF